MIRCPASVTPERRQFGGGQLSIGRGPNNDWILADPDRHLSKRHCQLTFRAGAWNLEDLSSNGTFLNHADIPIGTGAVQVLGSGDRISLGAYEFEVTIAAPEDEADFAAFAPVPRPRANAGANQADPFLAPEMLDPFAPPPVSRPFGAAAGPMLRADSLSGDDGNAIRLPADFDPLAEDDEPFRGPTQSDHAPAIEGAFRPPPPPAAVIPDDWDLDLPLQRAAASERPPGHEAAAPPQRAAPAVSRATVAAPSPDVSAPVTGAQAILPRAAGSGDKDLMAAFIRGAGLDEALVTDASLGDPHKTMESVGKALRAAVSGLRQVLIARASIKAEFRIGQTMIQAAGNNPLKFSADDDTALTNLLGLGRRSTRPPAESIDEALRDMRLHELASISAMQTAVRTLLAQFDPATINERADKSGLGVLPVQRKARAWETFEALHMKVSQALADDFDSVFGKAFARAYEQAIDELSANEAVR